MIRLGFIGLGLMGAKRAKIAEALGHTIAFAVDPDPNRLAAFEAKSGSCATSLGDLESGGFEPADAIFVAVPHDLAVDASTWAFSRSAHVLCEKPMGRTLGEAKEIARAARASGKLFCAGFNYRYLAGVGALRNLLREEKFGRVFRVRMAIGHGGRPGMETEWKLKFAKAGGGALIDPGIHLVDLALHMFGAENVTNVSLRRCFWRADVEDNCALTLVTGAGDIEVAIDVSLAAWTNHFSIEVYGSDGMAIVAGRGGNYGTQRLEYVNRWFWQGDDKRSQMEFGADDRSLELETRAFLAAVEGKGGDGVLSGVEAGCAALRVVESAYGKSARKF